MDCVKCGDIIPPKRIAILPNARTCVKCSNTSKLVGVPISIGKGDEIYTDLNIMSQDTFKDFSRLQRGTFNEITE